MTRTTYVWATSRADPSPTYRHHWKVGGLSGASRAVCRSGGVHYREDLDYRPDGRPRCPDCLAGLPAQESVR